MTEAQLQANNLRLNSSREQKQEKTRISRLRKLMLRKKR